MDLDDWEECNGLGFGRLKKGTVPSKNLPENFGDLTLGASTDIDHTTPDEFEKIQGNLERNGDSIINDHDYSTRNSNNDLVL